MYKVFHVNYSLLNYVYALRQKRRKIRQTSFLTGGKLCGNWVFGGIQRQSSLFSFKNRFEFIMLNENVYACDIHYLPPTSAFETMQKRSRMCKSTVHTYTRAIYFLFFALTHVCIIVGVLNSILERNSTNVINIQYKRKAHIFQSTQIRRAGLQATSGGSPLNS